MKRRILKIAGWTVGSLLGLAAVLVAAVLILGNTDPGRRTIESWTRKLTLEHVLVSGLQGSFPDHLLIARLELRDPRGVWLSAERITLDWSPLAWLSGRIQIDALHASLVDMQRLPQGGAAPAPNAKPASIPRIEVGRISIDTAKLGSELAGRPAELALDGAAHLYSVQDMRFDVRARRIDDTGTYVLKLAFDRKRMDADLDLREPASGPLENILGLPGLGALRATAALHGERSAERLDIDFDAGALRGSAHGTFDLTTLAADMQFGLESSALAPRPDLAWERAGIQGRWHGSVKAPNADFHVDIAALRLPGGARLAGLRADASAARGEATLRATVSGLRIPGPQPALLEDSPLEVEAAMRLDDDRRPLRLSASHRVFSLQGTANTAGTRTASLELSLPSLAAFDALLGQHLRGKASVKADGELDRDDVRIKAAASANLEPGKEAWAQIAGRTVSLQLAGAVTPQAFVVDSLSLAARAGTASASGELSRTAPGAATTNGGAGEGTPPGPKLRARWAFAIPDLRTLGPALAGKAEASGQADGRLDALSLAGKASSTLSVRGSPPGELRATFSARGLPSAPSGSLIAEGSLDGAPLHVDVEAERARPGSLHARIARAAWKSARADGEITFSPNQGASHGQLHLEIARLGDLERLAGAPLSGSVDAQMALRPDRGGTHAQIHLTGRDVKAGAFAGNADLSAEGATDALNFKATVQVPKLNGAALGAAASGSFSASAQDISLMAASVAYRGQSVRLLAPAHISFAQGLRIEGVKLGAQRAVLEANGTVSPSLNLEASVRGVDPALVNAFIPGLLDSGEIEAHARIAGEPGAPTGELSAAAKNIRFRDDAALGLPPLNARAAAQLHGDSAEVDFGLEAGSASKLEIKGTAPLAAGGAVDLKVRGDFDAGMFNAVLEARGQHATGELAVDATVAGSLDAPRIGGTLNLTKGSIRDYSRGLGLTDITATLAGAEGKLEIKTFTAAAAPGNVTMSGSVGVLQAGVPIDLQIKAEKAQPIASKLVTANLDAELTVKGKLKERIDLAGNVKLHRTLIGVPNSLPPNVAVLDVRRRGQAVAAPEKQLVIGLNLRIESLQGILVQGRGLDAEVGGNLRLGGTTDSPTVSGGFELQRGTFSIGGSKLNFNQGGRVSFNGAGLRNRIDPTLDFTAQSTVGDVTATLQISGLADAPQFEFSSSPSLPQDEIMARLLFGAPAAQLTGLQLAETGAALATLSGVGGDNGLNPLAKLQKSLGLDRLSIGAGASNATGTENTGASIEAGRYVTRRVFIAAKQSTQGTSQLEADIELTKRLKLQTRLGNGTSVAGTTPENDPGSSVGLSYQIEY